MGGLKALRQFFDHLPSNLPVAIMIVQHLLEDTPSELPFLLRKHTSMQVKIATSNEVIKPGTVYVSPNGKHMLVDGDQIIFGEGMRDNGMRPSVNTLFRSAAANFSQKLIGIVLTGLLTDGSEGLKAIKEMGGITIVQDPEGAEYPDMPISAIKQNITDYIIPIEDMGNLLKILTKQAIKKQQYTPSPQLLKSIEMAAANISDMTLMGINKDNISTDDSLANILQVMQERTNMLENLAEKELLTGRKSVASIYYNRATESRIHTENLRNLLYGSQTQKLQKV